MMDEDAIEGAICPICGAVEFWECGHLIADIDITFCEVNSGELLSDQHKFAHLMEDRLRRDLRSYQSMTFLDERLDQHWKDAVRKIKRDSDYIEVSDKFFCSWLIFRLLEAGAIDANGPVVNFGPPGFSSEMRRLFSDNPERIIGVVLQRAKEEFK